MRRYRAVRSVGYARLRRIDNVACSTGRRGYSECVKDPAIRWRQFFTDAPIMCVVTRLEDGVAIVHDCNGRFCEALGYTRDEVIGAPLSRFYTEASRAALEHGGYDRALHGTFADEERQFVRRDGTIVETILRAVPDQDAETGAVGTCAMFIDIGDRKRAEQSNVRHAQQLESIRDLTAHYLADQDWASARGTLLDRAADDLDGTWAALVTRVGERVQSTLRRRGQAVVERSSTAEDALTLSRDDASLFFDVCRTFQMPRAAHYAVHRFGSAELGGALIVAADARLSSDADSAIAALGETAGLLHAHACQASTERRLQRSLRQAQKLEAVGRLAGGIAHDFNNQLMAMSALCTLLREDLGETSPSYEDVTELDALIQRSAAMTKELLLFGGRPGARAKTVAIDDVLRDARRMLQMLAADTKIEFRLAAGDTHVEVMRSHIEQVATNLVINASDAMHGGGQIEVETSREIVPPSEGSHPAIAPPGRYVRLRVVDHGEGMDAEAKERIFEPFFGTKEKGTGLGLATVYGIVTGANGFVTVESELGEGSTFDCYLPEHQSSDRPRPAPAPRTPVGGDERILLVEDQETVRDTIARYLDRLGYRYDTAVDGMDALHRLEEDATRWDLVLSDIVMPNLGGIALARLIRSSIPGLPVVLMSGYSYDDGTEAIGGAPVLRKPFAIAELARVLRETFDATR